MSGFNRDLAIPASSLASCRPTLVLDARSQLCSALKARAGAARRRELQLLSSPRSLSPLLCPVSLCPPVYCLSYRPIHERLSFFSKWRRSQPAGGSRMEAKRIQKGLLSPSLFILFRLPRVSIHSVPLFISLPLPVCVSGDCLKSRVHAEQSGAATLYQ